MSASLDEVQKNVEALKDLDEFEYGSDKADRMYTMGSIIWFYDSPGRRK